MDQLHQKLMEKKGWYHFWHGQKGHHIAHWTIFSLVIVLIAAVFIGDIKPGWLDNLRSGAAADAPELPRSYLLTSVASTPVTGRTLCVAPATGSNCVPMADFQTALTTAVLGDEVVLNAGTTYTGNFTLPNKTSGSGWITIRTSNLAELPEGYRVKPADAPDMPKILSPNTDPTLKTDNGAHHYRFIGLEIGVTATSVADANSGGNHNSGIVRLGSPDETILANQAHSFIFDRVYLHGRPNLNTGRGLYIDSNSTAVVDSYLSDFHYIGRDSQAILVSNADGPYKFVNNYIEGAGENIMFGGAGVNILNVVPGDAEIRRNHFFKPLSWRKGSSQYAGYNWTIKNLFEVKSGERILLDGNIFENNWAGAQTGTAINLKSADGTFPANTNPWSVAQDITFTNNIVKNSGSGIVIVGQDGPGLLHTTSRVKVANNLFDNINGDAYSQYSLIGEEYNADGDFLRIFGAHHVTVDHNTVLNSPGMTVRTADQPNQNFVYTNNISAHNAYGIKGDGTGIGNSTLNAYFPGLIFQKNILAGGNASDYPTDNYLNPPASLNDVGFTNYNGGNGGDYLLTASSPYNGIGADINALRAAVAGVVEGVPSGSAPTSPPTGDTTAPTTSITSPKNDSTVNGMVTVAAAATDNVSVVKVELYLDETLLATDTSSPYSFSWDTLKDSNGGYALQTKATDGAGNVGSSTVINVSVSNPTPSATPSITSFSVAAKTATSSTIIWATNQPTTGIVKYGTSKTNLNLSVADTTSKTAHSVTITGLSSKVTYYYQIQATNANGTASSIISSFRTKPR